MLLKGVYKEIAAKRLPAVMCYNVYKPATIYSIRLWFRFCVSALSENENEILNFSEVKVIIYPTRTWRLRIMTSDFWVIYTVILNLTRHV